MRKKDPVQIVEVRPTTRRLKLVEKVCPVCGKTFLGMALKKYDTIQCAKRAAYAANPDAYRQARMRSYRKKQSKKND